MKSFINNASVNEWFAQQMAALTPMKMVMALSMGFVVGLIIALVYRKAFRGVLYSPSFATTLIMLCMITTPVVMCIKSNILFRSLIKVPEIQDRFLTRYGQYFQTVFTTQYLTDLFNKMILQIQPEMMMHMQRWAALMPAKLSLDQPKNPEGGYNYWVTRCERMLTRIFPRRPYYMWQEIQQYFSLTTQQMEAYFGPCPANPDE